LPPWVNADYITGTNRAGAPKPGFGIDAAARRFDKQYRVVADSVQAKANQEICC